MALKKDEVKKPAGGFENDAAPAPKVSDAAAAAAGVSASTAVAKVAANAVALGGKLKTVFGDLENALPSVGFGVLPRLVGTNGQIQDNDKKFLGTEITLQLVSWNKNFVVSPGDDSDEAKAKVRYSRDGESIDDTGESVAGYLKQLREVDGYEDAKSKEYVSLIGILMSSEKQSDLEGGMVEVSLSPQSAKLFYGFRLQESVKVQLGHKKAEGIEVISVKTEVKTQGSNTFTLLKTGAVKAKVAA